MVTYGAEYLPSMCEALLQSPAGKRKRRKRKREERRKGGG